MPDILAILSALGILLLKELFSLFGFLTDSEAFPQPLTPEEEEKYLELSKKGVKKARDILIERNLRLVAHVVKKYSTKTEDLEDLISIGTIGLIKAIDTYDKEKANRLATYAARCIENEILMNLRSTKKLKNEFFLQEPIGVDKEGNEISLLDILGSDTDAILDEIANKLEQKRIVDKIKNSLKGREKKVLELRFGLNNGIERTQREVAKMLGISRSYVSRIEKKAIKRLSEELLNKKSCD